MILTAKPLTVTLSRAEQTELRRYMESPNAQIGTDLFSDPRLKYVKMLEEKGYLERTAIHAGFVYHKINPKSA